VVPTVSAPACAGAVVSLNNLPLSRVAPITSVRSAKDDKYHAHRGVLRAQKHDLQPAEYDENQVAGNDPRLSR
jgi:hypothetical protein